MKLLIQIIAVALTFFVALTAIASERVEQEYVIKDVLEVQASSGVRLERIQGETESLKLKTSAELLKHVHVDLTDGKLTLTVEKKFSDPFSWMSKDDVVFSLAIKNLQLIGLSGGVDAKVGKITLPALTIKSSGGADSIFTNLNVKDLSIEASGGSDIKVDTLSSETVRLQISGGSDFNIRQKGTTNSLAINAGGGSNCNAKNLDSFNADVIAGGASDVEVNASKTLKVNAGGASDIDYYGNPQITSHINGASDLTAHK
ncbi:MAG: DUF2807 domain-containing protein [Gammaproteobacteria bacterium]|nr:MAG: DUF2807 domain-containing protein [Gammaproteobacteria bacterium]